MQTNPIQFSLGRVPQVIFGVGSLHQLARHCAGYGKQMLLVTGGQSFEQSAYRHKLEQQFHTEGLRMERYPVRNEPSPEDVDRAVELYSGKGIELVVAIGGGSVLDAGKAIAARFMEEGSITHYLEGVGTRTPSGKRLPLIAVPTTAGTGSEATKNAVITRQGPQGFKKSLRHENYVPDIALIDPELSCSCSPAQTAASGLDAFSQLLEAYVSVKANPFTDALAWSGLQLVANSLEKAVEQGYHLEARSGMAYAALLSGICLANAGLGLVHGFAQPLGSLFPIPHGVVCGSLLYAVNRVTIEHLRQTDPQNRVLKKFARVGQLFQPEVKNTQDSLAALLDKLDELTGRFALPKFSEFGVGSGDVNRIIGLTELKNHPIALSEDDIREILMERI